MAYLWIIIIFLGLVSIFALWNVGLDIVYEKIRDAIKNERKCNYAKKQLQVAIDKYSKSAEAGDVEALFYLANAYAEVAKYSKPYTSYDYYEKSFLMFKKAAELGCPEAEYNLAVCYAQGYYVSKDDVKARKWLESAAQHGDELARKKLDEIKYDEERQRKKAAEEYERQKQLEPFMPILNALNAVQKQNKELKAQYSALQSQSEKIAEERNRKISELNDSVRKHQEQVKAVENELWKLNNK